MVQIFDPFVVLASAIIIIFGIIGFIDDYRKVILRDAKGVSCQMEIPASANFCDLCRHGSLRRYRYG